MFFGRKPETRVPLLEVMRLRGAYLPHPLPAAAAAQLEEAKSRCRACNVKQLCDQALTAGDAKGFSLFCPNSHYMQQLRSASLRFT